MVQQADTEQVGTLPESAGEHTILTDEGCYSFADQGWPCA